MSNVIVLGAGMVGSAMAIDMAKNHNVTLTDLSQAVLDRVKQKCSDLTIKQLDATNVSELQSTIKQYDLVICAVPGFMGFETLKNIINAEMNVIDISFFPENSLELNKDRFCKLFGFPNMSFQLLQNIHVKNLYCKTCN